MKSGIWMRILKALRCRGRKSENSNKIMWSKNLEKKFLDALGEGKG